ncbi:MAG: hypothetical protein ABIN25_00550 [Ginsengibacter sp.]
MDLRKTILIEHSKANCDKIVEWIGDDKKRFDELLQLFLNDEYRISQRAAWPLSCSAIAHPELMENNFEKIIKNLCRPKLHDAVKRNTVRLLQHIDIPERHEGEVMNICFQYVESPTEAIAIKAFSLTILGKLAKKFPEILPEIKLLIEEQAGHQSAAFKSRSNRLLKEHSLL